MIYTTVMEVDLVKLKELREDQAYSARELAKMAGVNYRTVLRIEHGQTNVQPRTLRKLAAALWGAPRDLRAPRGGGLTTVNSAKERVVFQNIMLAEIDSNPEQPRGHFCGIEQ